MKQYELFILTLEGRVAARYDLICADDSHAKTGLRSSILSMQSSYGRGRVAFFTFRRRSRDARPV
jgi:hypothetical protein